MTGRERRLLRMLCMTAGGGGGGGDKPWDEMTWDDVIAATKNGKYKNFEIGAMKELDLGSEGVVHMQIVGIDADDLADGSGKAPLTFISKELLKTSRNMNTSKTTTGGWESTAMRTYLKNTIKPLIPLAVAVSIKEVTKYSKSVNPANTDATTTDDVWIPSNQEIFGGTNYETLGHVYSGVFTDANSRNKFKVGASRADIWWLRSAYNATLFRCVGDAGNGITSYANNAFAIALGFCL